MSIIPSASRVRRLVRWLFAPRKLIRIQQIELMKLHKYNGSLAQENHKLWAELSRIESPLAAAREACMAAELEAAMQKERDENLSRLGNKNKRTI